MKTNFENNIENDGGFQIPNQYFEKSTTNILNKISAKTALPIENMERGFTVPENYFEKNRQLILKNTKTHSVKKFNLFTKNNWFVLTGIAAMLIAVIGLFVFVNTNNTNNLSAATSKISDDEIIDYLTTNDITFEWINDAVLSPNTNKTKTIELEQYLLEHADEQVLLDEL